MMDLVLPPGSGHSPATTCVVVGRATSGSCLCSAQVYAWIFTNGRPGATIYGGTEATFYADSCISLSTCWIVGSRHNANVVVGLKDGVLGTFERAPDAMGAIECEHVTCQAAGGTVILTITNGVVTGTPVISAATTGFAAITNRGTGFAAIGGALKKGYSEVVLG